MAWREKPKLGETDQSELMFVSLVLCLFLLLRFLTFIWFFVSLSAPASLLTEALGSLNKYENN